MEDYVHSSVPEEIGLLLQILEISHLDLDSHQDDCLHGQNLVQDRCWLNIVVVKKMYSAL